VHEAERFDPTTGEPQSWSPTRGGLGVHRWARQWLAEQWPEWAPRTRASAIEALARLVVLATDPPPDDRRSLRRYVERWLVPNSDHDEDPSADRWLDRNALPITTLSRAATSEIERGLGVGVDGKLLGAATASRYRKVVHACILGAVDRELLPTDPWPRTSVSRARRKAARIRKSVDVRHLPDAATMERALDAIVSPHPGSRKYRAMTAVVYYGGLRPSEVVMLRRQALDLPDAGWGSIMVTEADISFDEPGEPKTGPRPVPIPPVLVEILRSWTVEAAIDSPEALLFRTRNGNRPTASNWNRAWQRALAAIDPPEAEGLRLSPRRGHDMARRRRAARRSGATPRTQRRNARVHVRRRPHRRRTTQQRTNRGGAPAR
jgi:integrase